MNQFPSTLIGFYTKYAVKPFKWILFFWALFFMLMRVGYGISGPFSEKWFVALLEHHVPEGLSLMSYAWPTIALIIGITLACDAFEITAFTLSAHWRPKVQNHISEILNDYVHAQSMSFFTSRMPGKINTQIGYVAGGFQTIGDFTHIISAFIVIFFNLGMVLSLNASIAFVLVGTFVFRLIYSIWRAKPMNLASKAASESSSSLSGKLIDSISNFSIVKLFAGGGHEHKYMLDPRSKYIKNRIYTSYMQRLFWSVPSVLNTFLFGVILVLCILMFKSGEMKISEIVFTISTYWVSASAIANIVDRIPDLVDVIGSAQQSYHELIKPIEVPDAVDAKDLIVKNGAINISGVSFKYKRKMILNNFSLKISAGEKVGLVGGSGAGKTTLVNLLMRFYDPTKGLITIDGQDIRNVKQDTLRDNIGFIPQEPTMFNRTLRDNIGYGKPEASDAEIRKAAKKAQADSFIAATEKKYDSLVGDRGIKLSGGQRQRVAIARAFLKNAPILILDEATSALDSETEYAIQKSFEELSRGRTTIAIAHRLSTLRNMDRIIVMDNGKIAEQGTHDALLKRRGIYARLWKMQSGGFINESVSN